MDKVAIVGITMALNKLARHYSYLIKLTCLRLQGVDETIGTANPVHLTEIIWDATGEAFKAEGGLIEKLAVCASYILLSGALWLLFGLLGTTGGVVRLGGKKSRQ